MNSPKHGNQKRVEVVPPERRFLGEQEEAARIDELEIRLSAVIGEFDVSSRDVVRLLLQPDGSAVTRYDPSRPANFLMASFSRAVADELIARGRLAGNVDEPVPWDEVRRTFGTMIGKDPVSQLIQSYESAGNDLTTCVPGQMRFAFDEDGAMSISLDRVPEKDVEAAKLQLKRDAARLLIALTSPITFPEGQGLPEYTITLFPIDGDDNAIAAVQGAKDFLDEM